jgi:hypothetical protein
MTEWAVQVGDLTGKLVAWPCEGQRLPPLLANLLARLERIRTVCLIAILALFSARLADLFLWIFTDLVSRAFHHTFIFPALGIIFLPWTTLMYVLVWTPAHGLYGFGWFWVVLGVFFDLASYSQSAYSNRARLGYA